MQTLHISRFNPPRFSQNSRFLNVFDRQDHSAHELHCPQAVKEIVKTLFALQQLEERRGGANGSAAAALRDQLPRHILERHEKRRARGQRTVAIARGDVCGECHLKIPLAVERALILGADAQTCTNCGRYLILFSEEHSAPKTPAA